jgi:hypothetical protein
MIRDDGILVKVLIFGYYVVFLFLEIVVPGTRASSIDWA